MFHVAPRGASDGHPFDRTGTPASPSEPNTRPPLADARDEADAIRAEAERQAAQIIRDAEERADLLLKARLAYAERELDRLRSLRRNIGTLLEGSVSALRVVEHMLPNDRTHGGESESAVPAFSLVRAFAGRYRYAMIVALCLAIAGALAGAAWYAALPEPASAPAETTARAADVLLPPPAVRQPEVAFAPPAPSLAPAATTGASPAAAASPDQSAALTLLLSAERQCWIRATIDGERVIERLLEADQELVVTARESVLLRVGDAGALSMTINGKPAQRFGGPGEVITRQITRQNYSRWLLGLS